MATVAQLSTELANQTPVFDEIFLKDYISDMTTAPFLGRHQTETWQDGAPLRTFDKIHVGQPNYTNPWNKRYGQNNDGLGQSVFDCDNSRPTSNYVAFGSTRDFYFMENQNLYSQLFDLDQLRTVPQLGKQIAEIYRNLRKIPMGFAGDYLRTRFLSYHDTLQVCGSSFAELNIITADSPVSGTSTYIDPNANIIDLGGSANLPTSDLTWTYLEYFGSLLGLNGYDIDSGLPGGMRSLVTHSRTFQRLVGLNPEIRSQVRLTDFKSASPLYMPGKGINADPFGRFAPTFDEHQLRYQDMGNGRLERVLPYKNVAATTGLKPEYNPDWLNARYAISYIPHPKATTLFTPRPKKVHELIPSVNSAMWGSWAYINDKVLIYKGPNDASATTYNNELQWLFYWLCYLEFGFKYDQRPLVVPVLHLIDGAGKATMVDNPIAGSAPQYVIQDPSDDPVQC